VLLQNHAEPRAQRLQIAGVNVGPVDGNFSAVGLQQTEQTHYSGGLTAARAAHDSDLLSGSNVEGDSLEYVLQLRPIAH
jgi:hypothetical protein